MEDPQDCQPEFTDIETGTIICFLGANKFQVETRLGTVDAVLLNRLIPKILPYYQSPEKYPGVFFKVTIRRRPKPAMPQIIDVRPSMLSV